MISLTRNSAARAAAVDEIAPSRVRGRLGDALMVAVLATAVSLAGSARPSLWYDEAATISAAGNRSLGDMMRMLGHIDAVHGLYYIVMRGWFAVFPATEFWSRASSAVAVGIAAAGVVVLARQLSTRAVAVCAGVAFAILPATTWAGMEARPYALSAAATVWLTVLLIAAAHRTRSALWVLYGVATTLSILLNLCTVLMLVVHAAGLCCLPVTRTTVIRWTATSLTAVVIVSPFLVFARGQMFQVSWISPLKFGTIHDILVDQYFPHSNIFAIAAGVIIGVAVLLVVTGRVRPDDGERSLVRIALAWMVLPTAVFLLYSAVFDPMYFPRYLYFTTPAMALVLGACVAAVGRTPLAMAALLTLLALAAAPNYLFVQRGPYAKEGMDYSQVADLLTQRAAQGDCLVMDNTIRWKPGPIRAMTAARPSAFEKLVDPGRGPSAASVGRLWDGHLAIWAPAVAGRLARCDVLWIVSEHDNTRPALESNANLPAGPAFGDAPAYGITRFLGFHLVERWQFNFAQVMKATR